MEGKILAIVVVLTKPSASIVLGKAFSFSFVCSFVDFLVVLVVVVVVTVARFVVDEDGLISSFEESSRSFCGNPLSSLADDDDD